MKEKKNTVLIINTTEFGPGGVTKVIDEYYRATCRDGYEFDIVSITRDIPQHYARLFADHGSNVIYLPRKENTVKYFFGLLKQCLRRKYDVIHIHGNSATMAIELLAAFLGGVRKRIAHCHTTKCEHQKAHKLLMPLFSRLYTHGLACSLDAGNWIFGEGNFQVLNNAIDTRLYTFNPQTRQQYRQELNISDDTLLLGHIGYFNEAKNQSFLVDILSVMPPNTKLLLIGTGELMETVRQKVCRLGLEDRVIFPGVRQDIPQLLQAMDSFVFPSVWEGLGIALLEAQLSGLPCFASDRVPLAANICGMVTYLSLDDPHIWLQKLPKRPDTPHRQQYSATAIAAAIDKGYDIQTQAQSLLTLYTDISRNQR